MTEPDESAEDQLRCACPEVYAGSYPTGSRNWNPACPEHGDNTEWLRHKRETDPRWAVWTGGDR